MLVHIASIAHVHNLEVEHEVANFIEILHVLWFELHEHFGGLVGVVVTLDTHLAVQLLAGYLAQVLVL